MDGAVDNLEIGDDATERVEYRVEDQRLQRCFRVALGSRYALHDGVEYLFHSLARLARGTDDILAVASQKVDNLILHLVGHGAGHVYLVDDGNNLQVVVDGHIEVRDGLSLYALRGIDHEQCSLAGSDAAAHLVREVDMPRRVYQIEYILLPVLLIFHLDGVALDGDASLALKVHIVEHLSFGNLYGLRKFQETVGQGRLTVVDMSDDAEVPDILHV